MAAVPLALAFSAILDCLIRRYLLRVHEGHVDGAFRLDFIEQVFFNTPNHAHNLILSRHL